MEKSKTSNRYSPEVRARAVRMVLEHQSSYETQAAAIVAIAPKIGCIAETLRLWVRQDLGVSAYNGAGQLLQNGAYLMDVGKILSVEARHAATIRDMLRSNSTTFSGPDVVDKNGLDVARPPSAVLKVAGPFIKTKVTTMHLGGA